MLHLSSNPYIMMKKRGVTMHLIEIFHTKGQDTITMGSSCSSCSSGCESVSHSIKETIQNFNTNYSETGEAVSLALSDDNGDSIAIRLQEVYHNSGEGLIITGSNIAFILKKLAPIISIDGKLVANNYIPDADELKSAIDNDHGIYSTICQ